MPDRDLGTEFAQLATVADSRLSQPVTGTPRASMIRARLLIPDPAMPIMCTRPSSVAAGTTSVAQWPPAPRRVPTSRPVGTARTWGRAPDPGGAGARLSGAATGHLQHAAGQLRSGARAPARRAAAAIAASRGGSVSMAVTFWATQADRSPRRPPSARHRPPRSARRSAAARRRAAATARSGRQPTAVSSAQVIAPERHSTKSAAA